MKSIIRNDAEVRALLAGATALLLPMKPQPIGAEGFRYYPVKPYSSGDVIAVKEAWAVIDGDYGSGVLYRADRSMQGIGAEGSSRKGNYREFLLGDTGDDPRDVPKPERWNPAQQMPLEYSRIHLTVVSCAPRKTDSITVAESETIWGKTKYKAFDALDELHGHWTARYPKHPWGSWAWRITVEVKTI